MATPKTVRALFREKLNSEIVCVKFNPVDLERVDSDKYLMRILAHVNNNENEAVAMLWNLLVWRKAVGASDINENNINMKYVTEGSVFPYGRDIDGCLLLVFKPKVYSQTKKDLEESKRILIYWLDRLEREENGNKISIFCDMTNCGVNDLDPELISYIKSLFLKYYPHFLNYIIIFQMPWALSTTFKVIKSFLPARAAVKMKFLTKNKLSKVVQLEHALKCWGGKKEYVFQFVPECRNTIHKIVNHDPMKYIKRSKEMIYLKAKNTTVFKGNGNKLILSIDLTITNIHDTPIFFEVRFNSSDIFYINPIYGILDMKSSQNIIMVAQHNFSSFTFQDLTMEKFFVTTLQLPKLNMSSEELYDIWQNYPIYKIEEYDLKYILNEIQSESITILNCLNNLHASNQVIQEQLEILKLYQYVTLIVIIFVSFIAYWYL